MNSASGAEFCPVIDGLTFPRSHFAQALWLALCTLLWCPRATGQNTLDEPARVNLQRFDKHGPTQIGGQTYYPYIIDGHVHSHHSPDARHSPTSIMETAARLNMDGIVFTDHGSVRALREFSGFQGPVQAFIGAEIGGAFGHAVYWNVPEEDGHYSRTTSLAQRCDFAHAHGGLLVFAHPGWWIEGNQTDPMEWMTESALRRGGIAGAIDAIELWNGVYDTPLPKLIDTWIGLIETGVYVPIVGDSDFHQYRFHQLGDAHSIVLCDKPEIKTCLWPAVKQGRVIVSDGPSAVFSVNGQPPGSILQVSRQPLEVKVEALAREGGTLRLYRGREVIEQRKLTPGVNATFSIVVSAPSADSLLRIDIERPHQTRGQTPISLLSNPVLLDVAPLRSSWR
jgi:hypothetical protein